MPISGYVHGGESAITLNGVAMPYKTADQNRENRLANVGNVTTGGVDFWIPGQLGGEITLNCPKQLVTMAGVTLGSLVTGVITFAAGTTRSFSARVKSIKDGLDWDKEQTTDVTLAMSGTPFDITQP